MVYGLCLCAIVCVRGVCDGMCVRMCACPCDCACFCVSGWVVQVDDVCVCCVWGNGVWFGAYVWCCGAYVNIYYMYIYTSYKLVFIIDVLQT